jgi:hypothetical protein
MRVCCISDLHGHLPDDVPKCDLLLVAGDISAVTHEDNGRFLRRDFPNWLERQPAIGGRPTHEHHALKVTYIEPP